mgnify:CR=1 FL=1
MPQAIGLWQECFPGNENERWPHPRYFVGEWNDSDKPEILEYMSQAVTIEEPAVWDTYKAVSYCKLCDHVAEARIVTDGEWQWPVIFSHYIENHITPPKEFLESIRTRNFYFRDVIELQLAYKYYENFWHDYTAKALKQTIEDDSINPGKKSPGYSKI